MSRPLIIKIHHDPPEAGHTVQCHVNGWPFTATVIAWDPIGTQVTINLNGNQVTLQYQSTGDLEGYWIGILE